MKEVYDKLTDLMNKTIQIQDMDLPQSKKDEAIRLMGKTLDFVEKETSETRINQLVMEELRKNRLEKMKNE